MTTAIEMSASDAAPLRLSEDDEGATNVPDLLIKEYVYTQTFLIPPDGWGDFEALLETYLSYMLNDTDLLFYKATWFCGLEATPKGRLYTLHFFLFSHLKFSAVREGQAQSRRAELESPEFLRAHLSSKFLFDDIHFHTSLLAEESTLTRCRTFK